MPLALNLPLLTLSPESIHLASHTHLKCHLGSADPPVLQTLHNNTRRGFIGSEGGKISQTEDVWTVKYYLQMMHCPFIGRV